MRKVSYKAIYNANYSTRTNLLSTQLIKYFLGLNYTVLAAKEENMEHN